LPAVPAPLTLGLEPGGAADAADLVPGAGAGGRFGPLLARVPDMHHGVRRIVVAKARLVATPTATPTPTPLAGGLDHAVLVVVGVPLDVGFPGLSPGPGRLLSPLGDRLLFGALLVEGVLVLTALAPAAPAPASAASPPGRGV